MAKRLAKERGVELAGLTGSGPGGRIVRRDVEAAEAPTQAAEAAAAAQAPAAAAPPSPAGPAAAEALETAKGTVSVEELSKLQQTVARRMAESKATAPHFYLEAEVDMSRAVEARALLKASAAGRRGRSPPSTTWW